MTPGPDDELLEQLGRGDEAAVAELLAAYGPYLRAVARGHVSARMRAKFDSLDVVQSVWVQLVRKLRAGDWRPETRAEIKALLTTIARRRALNRVRHHAPAADREQPGEAGLAAVPDARQSRPSETARAEDLWQQMLRSCPADHHEVLRLRREGYATAEIAARTGLHEGSVRRILRQLARALADRSIIPPNLDAPAPGPQG